MKVTAESHRTKRVLISINKLSENFDVNKKNKTSASVFVLIETECAERLPNITGLNRTYQLRGLTAAEKNPNS